MGGTISGVRVAVLQWLWRRSFEPTTGTSSLQLGVTLSAASSQPVSVSYTTADGTAIAGNDYIPVSGTLVFSPGETSKTIAVSLLSDTQGDEGDETFTLILSNATGATLASSQAVATIVDKVVRPDTGVTTCANATSNTLSCPQTGFPRQDAEEGRDSSNNDGSDGRAGFSFTKLDANGAALAAAASAWSCVRDEVTGLIWEIKTAVSGLRNVNGTFTWYNPDGGTNGGNAGVQSPAGGSCTGVACNTAAYVAAVNAEGLCGASDWRMPTADELLSLEDYGTQTPPGIDTAYFNDVPISGPLVYWASETDASNTGNAWVVDYAIGAAGNASVSTKDTFWLVRLVRKP